MPGETGPGWDTVGGMTGQQHSGGCLGFAVTLVAAAVGLFVALVTLAAFWPYMLGTLVVGALLMAAFYRSAGPYTTRNYVEAASLAVIVGGVLGWWIHSLA